MIDGELYLIVQEYGINGPIIWNDVRIGYDSIYIPVIPDIIYPRFESTYIISSINVESGDIENTVALVGSYSNTVYVSEENIYFAYELDYNEDKLRERIVYENGKFIINNTQISFTQEEILVITSYSIHYTKLYDIIRRIWFSNY